MPFAMPLPMPIRSHCCSRMRSHSTMPMPNMRYSVDMAAMKQQTNQSTRELCSAQLSSARNQQDTPVDDESCVEVKLKSTAV